jgi:hypothetical protein
MARKTKKRPPLLGSSAGISKRTWLAFIAGAVLIGVVLTITTFAADPSVGARDASREIARELGDSTPVAGTVGTPADTVAAVGPSSPSYGLALASVVVYSGIALVIIVGVAAAYSWVKSQEKSV